MLSKKILKIEKKKPKVGKIVGFKKKPIGSNRAKPGSKV